MNVLNPEKVIIGGRRYRKMYRANDHKTLYVPEQKSNDEVYWEDEHCDADQMTTICDIQKTNNGYIVYCSDIPSYYFKFICGKKNESKARIEKETKTQIKIPRPGLEGDIVIRGEERVGVMSAKSRIELIVESARRRSKPTHFISIPLATDSTKERFLAFKRIIVDNCSKCRGFDEEIIQISEKFHLTFGVMPLMNGKEVARAAGILSGLQEEIQSKFINGKPLKIILEGVECMNDDPSEVVVLYAKVKLADGTDRLQILADFIVDKFVAAGLMKREYERVKLHATIINTNFKRSSGDNDGANEKANKFEKRPNKITYFDARKVFELCHDFKFGEVDADTIHLSKRGQYGPDGFYFCESSIRL